MREVFLKHVFSVGCLSIEREENIATVSVRKYVPTYY